MQGWYQIFNVHVAIEERIKESDRRYAVATYGDSESFFAAWCGSSSFFSA